MPLPPGWSFTAESYGWRNQDFSVQNYAPPSKEEIDADKHNDPTQNWDWQNQDKTGPQGQALPEFAIGWKPTGEADFGTGLSAWWNKAKSNVRSAWQTGYNEGLSISGITKTTIATTAQGTGQDANKLLEAEKAKRKPDNQNQAYWAAAAEGTKAVFNEALWGVLNGLSQPAILAEKVLGTAGYTLADAIDPNRDVNSETLRQNWNASQLAYSGIFDATIMQEMNRRVDAGMRPDLAAQDIMVQKKWTMWPELIGQVVFDPLNVVSAFTKAGEAIRVEKSVAKMFHEVQNPAIAKILEDVSHLDEAGAYKYIDELVKTQQGLTASMEHADDISKAGKDLESLSNSYKLSSLTRDGKVSHLANQTSEIFMHIVNNSDPSEALEILRGMANSVSKDPKIAAEGISAMMHFADPAALFSEAGNKTTVMMSKMVEKYGDNFLETIDKLKGDPTELTKNLLGKLDEVGGEMFPSVSDMLKAEETIKKGGQVSEKISALAERAKQLPEYVKAATRFHDSAQQFVGPVNKFFVGAYMGWNPGYAFRNFSNNTMQLLIDYGPGILLGKADDIYANAEKLHGGVLQGAFGFGQAKDVIGDLAKTEGATTVKGTLKAIAEKTSLKNGPAQILAGKFEENAAKRIISKSYMKTFEQGVGAMVKALAPDFKAVGFSDDIIKKLPTYIMQNDGDAKLVINALRNDIASGTVDLFNDISRIDPKYKAFLSDAGKWDEYAQSVLKAQTREEAVVAAKKIFDDVAQAGDYVYREGRPAVSIEDKTLKMFEQGGLSPQRGQMIAIRQTESRKAIQVAEDILTEAKNAAGMSGIPLPLGDIEKAHGLAGGIGVWGKDAATEARRLQELANNLYKSAKKRGDLKAMWLANKEFFPGELPANLDYNTFADALWTKYDELVSVQWGTARDKAIENATGYLDDLKKAGVPIKDEWGDTIKQAQEGAQQYDKAMVGRFGELVEEKALPYGSRSTQIRQIAQQSGIATATEAGVATDKKTLAIINKYADVNYKSLEDVPMHVAEEAFAKKAGKVIDRAALEAEQADLNTKIWRAQGDELKAVQERLQKVDELLTPTDTAHFDDAHNLVEPTRGAKRILPPPTDGELPPVSRAIHEQMSSVGDMRAWVMDDIEKNFGKKQLIDKVAEGGLQKAEKELTQKLAETRLISSRVAQANRDFTLLNYGEKSYWDVALAYLYPFHFWYKGTYGNWLKRVATNPAILGHYARYKNILGTVHSGMPDWWKYNINTNDLPGVDVENPLFFNLEATLWPLNGLTNTDFNDPSKRVNWWTYTLDFANKFGPSTWTPINMVTGLMLYNKGEKEAGEKWMGRLFPQSNVIKAAGSLLGQANLETDPLVKMLQGGLDPYERRRVGRALAEMEQQALQGDLPYTQEQIQDAAYKQEGPVWDEAVKRAVNGRAPSQISSFLFGVGFKGRTQEDQEVDKFYSDYSKLWTMRPNITPDEFRQGMDKLYEKYPFADTVLLSNRTGVERDAGLAYNTLKRIPPGQTSEIAKAVGIDPALLDKFFTDKGQIDKWAKGDYDKFMAGVVTISAVLEIPSDMTREEWTQAKNAYNDMSTDAKKKFGDNILDVVDGYYQAKTVNKDAGNNYLEGHPEVSQYMDWKAQRVMGSPLLSSYYGGASMIEGYYRSKMYDDIETKLGKEIFGVMDEYNSLKTYGDPAEAKAFYSHNKAKIKQYYSIKDEWTYTINQYVAKMSAHIPEGQGVSIRPDINPDNVGAQQLAQSVQPQQQPSYQEFQQMIPERIMNLVQDYYLTGEPLPESATKQLERLANDMGYPDSETLLQAIGTSLYAQQAP